MHCPNHSSCIIAKFIHFGGLKHNGDGPEVELNLTSHKFHVPSAPSSTLPVHIADVVFIGQRNTDRCTFNPRIILPLLQ